MVDIKDKRSVKSQKKQLSIGRMTRLDIAEEGAFNLDLEEKENRTCCVELVKTLRLRKKELTYNISVTGLMS